MGLITYPIRNYQFTLIMVLMVIAVGVSSMLTMPRSEDPEMKSPNFPVVVIYPGTTPKDMEQLIVKPMESRFYDLDNIRRIRTTIENGLAVLFIEFDHGVDYDSKYQELIREVSALRPELPEGVYRIDVNQLDPTGVNVLQVALISENAPRKTLKRVADELQDELEKVKALSNGRPVVTTSILQEQGIIELEEAIAKTFFEGQVEANDLTYVSNARHIALLHQAKSTIEDAIDAAHTGVPVDMIQIDVTKTWELLGEIVGDTVQESLINQLFSQFCLGK